MHCVGGKRKELQNMQRGKALQRVRLWLCVCRGKERSNIQRRRNLKHSSTLNSGVSPQTVTLSGKQHEIPSRTHTAQFPTA
jgi:hypothetical protein